MNDSRSPNDTIHVRGARVHNLRDVDVALPKRKLVVFTGVSGSGKSSLAFDTLFAEGQRRYVESLSVYARMFLTRASKPDVDGIDGVSPTVSIEQKTASNNPRSTVGTITEVYDHLRVLFGHLGKQHCPQCGALASGSTPKQITEAIAALPEGTRYILMAPLVRNRKGEFRDLFARLRREGYTRARVDGDFVRLDELDALKKSFKHDIDAVVDRLIARPGVEPRLADAVRQAAALGEGRVLVRVDGGEDDGEERFYSAHSHCADCGISFPTLSHQSFSFNSPVGWCDACHGLGTHPRMDPARVVPDPSLSLADGALEPLRNPQTSAQRAFQKRLDQALSTAGIDRKKPWSALTDAQRDYVLAGGSVTGRATGRAPRDSVRKFEGVLAKLEKDLAQATSETQQARLGAYLIDAPCPDCDGARLRPESRAVRLGGRSLPEVCADDVAEAIAWATDLRLTGEDALVGDDLVAEVRSRLRFLDDVGLGYLSLARTGPTLSGGEAQRIRLARQIGSDLTGVLYVLDEPSIGLHQRDNERLLRTLERLRDAGNTVLVVEHDQDTIEAADWVVDFGPGAGRHGGEVTFSGLGRDLAGSHGNLTGDYLAGRRLVPIRDEPRAGIGASITVRHATANNLAGVDVAFPLGTLTCVTGVSGAGKSTLVNDILHPALANRLYTDSRPVGTHAGIDGADQIDKLIQIDQSPIGRTPRSNPATYTKVFDNIRAVFAELPDAKIYGYAPGRFSFNVAGGRCEACFGAGVQRIEMGFLADVLVECDQCRGRRFNDATLRVRYRGKSIADVLDMPFDDAVVLFEAHSKIRRTLQTVIDVGLGYLTLGQPSPTLSGGEAQRMKLSRELAKVATGRTLYILDEPTTGLHFEDVRRLLDVLHILVDAGNTCVVVEHNLDFIAAADHVIDIGPEGGRSGGRVVALGTPAQVAEVAESHTGQWLKRHLDGRAEKIRSLPAR
ncbi:MAG: excinuclease ABC subunit UvrA [Myxococcales bacterium]|nr:excinuclease ABC subunit UvrA [Myxococcales bacterium]MCB9531066.1 excinuclease ABC subunit UvrA [Myxococcales bacterium]MCB9532976.1 excinuclease ABC subunit UvrA [Myxococcales bacterium]